MVGMSVLMEELNKRVGHELSEYIREQDLHILGEPLPKGQKREEDFDVNCNIDLDFIFEVGLAPEIALDLNLKAIPAQYEVTVGDSFLEEEIKKNQERYGNVVQPETAEKGDILYGRMAEVDEAGTVIEGGFEKMVALNPDRVKKEVVFEQFLGKELESVMPFNPFDLHEDAKELAGLLFMDQDELANIRDKSFQITLKRINRVEAAELNADFFHKVLNPEQAYQQVAPSEEDKVETEEEFRKLLSERIAKEFDEHAKWYYRKQVREQLLASHEISLPETFLKRWIQETNRKKEDDSPLSPEEVDNQYVSYSESVRWSLLVEKIQDEYPEVKVEEAELKDGIREMILKNVPGIAPDQEEAYMQHALQNQEIIQGQYGRLLDEKLYKVLDGIITPKTEKIDAQAFLDQVNEA